MKHTQSNTKRDSAARARLRLATLVFSCLAVACDEDGHANGDGHAHAANEHDEQVALHSTSESAEHGDEVTLSDAAIALNGIRIEAVERRVLIPTLRAPSQVAFNSEGMAHVGIPVQGRVSELRVRLGDQVSKGDALLVVESAELGEAQSDLLQKRSAAANAQPAVELALNAHERARALYDKNQGIALTEVQRREIEYRAAAAGLAGAHAGVEAARNRLRLLGMGPEALERLATSGVIEPQFVVVAPIAGQVIEREATLGELVGPNREALLVLADTTKLWVIADVPEARLREIRKGARARVLLGSSSDHWCQGVVSFISPALNPATRTVQVRIEPTDHHEELRPGVFAQAEIEVGGAKLEAVLALPESATQLVEGALSVFVPVQGEPGTFAARRISVGVQVSGYLPVLSGLVEGERVVVDGSFILKAELGKAGAKHEH